MCLIMKNILIISILMFVLLLHTPFCNAGGKNKTTEILTFRRDCEGNSCTALGVAANIHGFEETDTRSLRRSGGELERNIHQEIENEIKAIADSRANSVITASKKAQKKIQNATKKGLKKVNKLLSKLKPTTIQTLSKGGLLPAAAQRFFIQVISEGSKMILDVTVKVLDSLIKVLKACSKDIHGLAVDLGQKVDNYGINCIDNFTKIIPSKDKDELLTTAEEEAQKIIEFAKDCDGKITDFVKESNVTVKETIETGKKQTADLSNSTYVKLKNLLSKYPEIYNNGTFEKQDSVIIKVIDDFQKNFDEVATDWFNPIRESGIESGKLILALGKTRASIIKALLGGDAEEISALKGLCKNLLEKMKENTGTDFDQFKKMVEYGSKEFEKAALKKLEEELSGIEDDFLPSTTTPL